MPDGTVIYARVDGLGQAGTPSADLPPVGGDGLGGEQGVDVRRRRPLRDAATPAPSRLTNFAETVRSVAASVDAAVAGATPRRVSVEFGLELAVESSEIVAVLAHLEARTSVKVRLDWDHEPRKADADTSTGAETEADGEAGAEDEAEAATRAETEAIGLP